MNKPAATKILFMIMIVFCSGSVIRAQNSYGGFQRPQQWSATNLLTRPPVPPDAYRNLDNQRMVDPRILEQQYLAQQAREKQQRFEAVKQEYKQVVMQKVKANPALWRIWGQGSVPLVQAMDHAATYYARKQVDGPEIAERWLSATKESLRTESQRMVGTEAILAAHDSVVAGAAAVAGQQMTPVTPDVIQGEQEQQSVVKPGVGQAASVAQQAESLSSGLAAALRYLEQLTH
ncbi:MAG: hypothetical protein ABSA97_11920 [Verrucomicrobiia bacterium]